MAKLRKLEFNSVQTSKIVEQNYSIREIQFFVKIFENISYCSLQTAEFTKNDNLNLFKIFFFYECLIISLLLTSLE